MKKLVLIAAPLALALAGCVSNETGTSSSTPTTATTASMSSVKNGPTRPPGGPNAAAEDLCVKAVQQQTNAVGVAVIGSEVSQAATQVMIGFPKSQAPWRCLVSGDRVTEVAYTGS
jgi:PBP1b-binding outer membrane lipoprotein LpoB